MIVIAGGGLAAQRCAERLRRAGHDGPIAMVCDEPIAPYDRPPLSKAYLAGELTEPPRLRPDAWYADKDVDVLLGEQAAAVRPREHQLELVSGQILDYEQLLIATGAVPRLLPGCEQYENVHVLRTLADADRLRAGLAPGARLAVVGAGFIGQEVASTARKLGAEVVLIEAMPAPLAHIVGEEVGDWFARLHTAEGVDMRTGVAFERISGNRRAERIHLADGSAIEADEFVVGIGVSPATGWLAGSPLNAAARNGRGSAPILADHAGRTEVPDVFAAGDCTGGSHWEAAVQQGAAAALAMLGEDPPPLPPSSFWSDLYGTRVNWLGNARGADSVDLDGDPDARDFTAIYRRGGTPVAGLLVGRPRALPELRDLIHPPTRKDHK
jgi:3-phenylpropionate/trans-cinnamate dioxygenase ferredoxin reductase subunit